MCLVFVSLFYEDIGIQNLISYNYICMNNLYYYTYSYMNIKYKNYYNCKFFYHKKILSNKKKSYNLT